MSPCSPTSCAHLGPDSTIADIARTKAALFLGMAPGATVVLNRDMLEWDRVHRAARAAGLNVVHYGVTTESEFQLVDYDPAQQSVLARIRGREIRYRLGAAGRHMALNSLSTLAALAALGHDFEKALGRIAAFSELPGRGRKLELELDGRRLTIIDDAYNANPGSMNAALERLGSEGAATRKVAVLGQMEELGPSAPVYHRELAASVEANGIDVVHVTGEHFAGFWEEISQARRGCYASSLEVLKTVLRDELRDGDIVLFKGSNSTRLHELVDWVRQAGAGDAGSPKPASPWRTAA